MPYFNNLGSLSIGQAPNFAPKPLTPWQADPLGSLADVVGEIAKNQRQRELDKLTRAKTLLDIQEGQRAQDAQAELQSTLKSAFAPEQLTGDTPATELGDEEYDSQRMKKTVDILRGLGSPESMKAADALQTRDEFKQQELALKRLGQDTSRLKIKASLAGKPEGAYNLAATPDAFRELYGPNSDPAKFRADYEAAKAANPPGTKIETMEDPNNPGILLVITRDRFGTPRIHNSATAQMKNAQAWETIRPVEVDRANIRGAAAAATFRKNRQAAIDLPTDAPKREDMYTSMGRDPQGNPLYKGNDGRTYVDKGGATGLQLYADGESKPPVANPAPTEIPTDLGGNTGPIPASGTRPILPGNLDGKVIPPRADVGAQGGTPVMTTPYEEKLRKEKVTQEVATLRNERQKRRDEMQFAAKDAASFEKTEVVRLYKLATQPMQNVRQAKQMLAAVAAKGEGNVTAEDMATLRQADNMLVRTAATLFEAKTGVVREGEVISLLGDETLGQQVYELLARVSRDRSSIDIMSPAIREAIIKASEAAYAEREDDMRYALSVSSPDVVRRVAPDLHGDLRNFVQGYVPTSGTASLASPTARVGTESWALPGL